MTDHIEEIRQPHGMFRNVPRSLRRAVERRLARLEADVERFDREALVSHARLKRLYALLHIKPGDRARPTLFGKPPAGTPRAALRQLAAAKDPYAAAGIVLRHGIPYLLTEAALGGIPEPVALALVTTLDGEELVGRLPLMARRGLLTGPVRDALLERLTALAHDPEQRLSYQKVEAVVRHAELDAALTAAVFALVQSGGVNRLAGDTALLVDASGSMPREGSCLELAAQIGRRVDQALDAGARLHLCLFGADAVLLDVRRGSGLDQWRRACTVAQPAPPGTSVGAAVEKLRQQGRVAGRLLIVTDGYENRPPRLVTALESFRAATGLRPAVELIQTADATPQLAVDLRNAQVPFGVFTVDRQLLGLDALVPALSARAGEGRVGQILAFRSST